MADAHSRQRTILMCRGCAFVQSRTPHAHAYDEEGEVFDTYFSRQIARNGLLELVDDGVIPRRIMFEVGEQIANFSLPETSGLDALYAAIAGFLQEMPRLAKDLEKAHGRHLRIQLDFHISGLVLLTIGPLKLSFRLKGEN